MRPRTTTRLHELHWVACALFAGVMVEVVNAGDWPQYRGPNHDGSSSETLRTDWNATPPKVAWKKPLGPGWSSSAVVGDRLFTQVKRPKSAVNREFCVALDVANGNEVWAHDVGAAQYNDLSGYQNSIDGPRSTPSVDGDRVYVFNSHLKLFCLRVSDGQELWSRDFPGEFPGTTVIAWQNAASPLVVGDLIYVNSNVANKRLMAIHKSDGTTAWSGQTDLMTHATPVFATIAGTPQVIFQTAAGLVGMSPDSNKVLWRYGFNPSPTSIASTPVVAGDLVYATCNYGYGAWSARITKSGDAFSVTDNKYQRQTSYQSHWASPVHHNGFLYTVLETTPKRLGCYDTVGRTNRWTTFQVGSGSFGFGSMIKVGNVLVVLTENGELVLVDPNPEAYTEIGRFKALNAYCWNHPVMANGRLYARSSSDLIALDVAPAVVPLPPLRLDATVTADATKLQITVTAVDGTPLTADDHRIVLEAADAVGAGPSNWNSAGASFTVDGSSLRAELPLPLANQFLRVRVTTAP